MAKNKPSKSAFFFLIVTPALLILSGCAMMNTAMYVPFDSKQYPAKPESAPILLAYDLDRPYEEMGKVIAYGRWFNGYAKVNEMLMNEARRIGADAVIKIHYREERLGGLSFILSLGYNVATGEGLAVRYKDERV